MTIFHMSAVSSRLVPVYHGFAGGSGRVEGGWWFLTRDLTKGGYVRATVHLHQIRGCQTPTTGASAPPDPVHAGRGPRSCTCVQDNKKIHTPRGGVQKTSSKSVTVRLLRVLHRTTQLGNRWVQSETRTKQRKADPQVAEQPSQHESRRKTLLCRPFHTGTCPGPPREEAAGSTHHSSSRRPDAGHVLSKL